MSSGQESGEVDEVERREVPPTEAARRRLEARDHSIIGIGVKCRGYHKDRREKLAIGSASTVLISR